MSKAIYDELVAAGAPELPDGYFYRVTRDRDDPYRIWVDLRKRTRFGSATQIRQNIFNDGFSIDLTGVSRGDLGYTPTELVAAVAQRCYGEWRFRHYEADMLARYDRFLGDHP